MIQIKVKDLSFSYSGFRALQDISFEAGAGDMLAIIGQNGSGKSTLLKCISRILKINTGHIEIGNISLSALSASKLSRIVAYIPQSTDSISGINVFDTACIDFQYPADTFQESTFPRAVLSDDRQHITCSCLEGDIL